MEMKEIANTIADIHNRLMDISVRGDDVFKLATCMSTCRSLVATLRNSELTEEVNDHGN